MLYLIIEYPEISMGLSEPIALQAPFVGIMQNFLELCVTTLDLQPAVIKNMMQTVLSVMFIKEL